jgi:predicted DNA-binding transcriptional regulator YafY
MWEKRTYKISRIKNIELTNKNFPYPDKFEWNPQCEFTLQSGLVKGKNKKIQVEVFGETRKIFADKTIFQSMEISKDSESTTYQLQYSNPEEFLGYMMGYLQDLKFINAPEIEALIEIKINSYIHHRQSKRNVA